MSKCVQETVSAEFISMADACGLLDQCEVQREVHNEAGSMTLHFLRHDIRGDLILVQGANGDFAVARAA